MSDSINTRTCGVISRSLGIKPEEISPELAMGSHPRWDSAGHMELVLALEEEFKIRFPAYAIAEITNVATIVEKLRELVPNTD